MGFSFHFWNTVYALLPPLLLWYFIKDVTPDAGHEWTQNNVTLQQRISALEKDKTSAAAAAPATDTAGTAPPPDAGVVAVMAQRLAVLEAAVRDLRAGSPSTAPSAHAAAREGAEVAPGSAACTAVVGGVAGGGPAVAQAQGVTAPGGSGAS